MKIYVASSWRNAYQPVVVELLRREGHEVYDFRNPSPGDNGFSWSEIDANWQFWSTKLYTEALAHPIAESSFQNDLKGMEWADVCVLVLPCNRSAHTEAGFMKGQGKPTFVYIPHRQEPELMYKVFDLVVDNVADLVQALIMATDQDVHADEVTEDDGEYDEVVHVDLNDFLNERD